MIGWEGGGVVNMDWLSMSCTHPLLDCVSIVTNLR